MTRFVLSFLIVARRIAFLERAPRRQLAGRLNGHPPAVDGSLPAVNRQVLAVATSFLLRFGRQPLSATGQPPSAMRLTRCPPLPPLVRTMPMTEQHRQILGLWCCSRQGRRRGGGVNQHFLASRTPSGPNSRVFKQNRSCQCCDHPHGPKENCQGPRGQGDPGYPEHSALTPASTALFTPPLPCACTALSKHGVGVEPPF